MKRKKKNIKMDYFLIGGPIGPPRSGGARIGGIGPIGPMVIMGPIIGGRMPIMGGMGPCGGPIIMGGMCPWGPMGPGGPIMPGCGGGPAPGIPGRGCPGITGAGAGGGSATLPLAAANGFDAILPALKAAVVASIKCCACSSIHFW